MGNEASDAEVSEHGPVSPEVTLVGTQRTLGSALGDRSPGVGVRAVLVDGPLAPTDGVDPSVLEAAGDVPTLAITDAHRTPTPIAFFDRRHPEAMATGADLPTPWVVDQYRIAPDAMTSEGVVAFEIGTADPGEVLDDVLAAFGEDPPARSPEFFAIADSIEADPGIELTAENFEQVAVSRPFGTRDGDRMVANWPFFPVLFGECGTPGTLGYRATSVGKNLQQARAALDPDSLT